MTLFSAKYVFLLLALVAVMGFALGFLHWDKSKSRCLVSRGWNNGSWHTVWAIGRLEFRAKDFDCDPSFKLDPAEWKSNGFGSVEHR